MKNWTDEDIRNAEVYGVCPKCGTPRQIHRVDETDASGRRTITSTLVAPCGHAIDDDPFGIPTR